MVWVSVCMYVLVWCTQALCAITVYVRMGEGRGKQEWVWENVGLGVC